MTKFKLEEEVPQKMEKGFGTCASCGKKTIGKSNTLCFRCGGTDVATLIGIKYDYHLDPVKHTLTDLRTGQVTKYAKGYPGPKKALRNGHCPKCHTEIVVIGAWACPKCGKF